MNLYFKILTMLSLLCFHNTKELLSRPYESSRNTVTILKEFKTSACLSNLFEDVVKANNKTYNPNIFYYSLTFKKGKKYNYLKIVAERWDMLKDTSFIGRIKIKKASFLYKGDLQSDLFYEKMPQRLLNIYPINTSDTLYHQIFTQEPSMQGIFKDCKGAPIYVEIYTEIASEKLKKRLIYSIGVDNYGN